VMSPAVARQVRDAVRKVGTIYGDIPVRRNVPRLSGEDARVEMFDVIWYDSTSVSVRAGFCSTTAHGTSYDTPLTLSAGTSGDPDDTKEVTIAADSWVYLQLTDSTGYSDSCNPDTLTASVVPGVATAPPGSTDGTVLPLAFVSFSGGTITDIQRCHVGTWFRQPIEPDGLSLDYTANTTGFKTQIHGWETAGTVGSGVFDYVNDLLPFQDADDFLALKYIDLYNLIASMNGNWTGIDLSGATWTNPPWTNDHGSLENLDVNSHHPWTWCNEIEQRDYLRNKGDSIGRIDLDNGSIGDLAIDLADSQLVSGGATLDWALLQLIGVWEHLDTTEATASNAASALFDGGIGVAKRVWADGGFCMDATNQWIADDGMGASQFHVSTDYVDIGETNVSLQASNTVFLNNNGSGVIDYGITMGSYPGQDLTDWFIRGGFIADDVTEKTLTVLEGGDEVSYKILTRPV
jgi:hypothetical protein